MLLAVAEQDQLGDAEDAVLLRRVRVVVYVQLGHPQGVRSLVRDLLDDRTDDMTRTAPFGPEVNQHRPVPIPAPYERSRHRLHARSLRSSTRASFVCVLRHGRRTSRGAGGSVSNRTLPPTALIDTNARSGCQPRLVLSPYLGPLDRRSPGGRPDPEHKAEHRVLDREGAPANHARHLLDRSPAAQHSRCDRQRDYAHEHHDREPEHHTGADERRGAQ